MSAPKLEGNRIFSRIDRLAFRRPYTFVMAASAILPVDQSSTRGINSKADRTRSGASHGAPSQISPLGTAIAKLLGECSPITVTV